MKLTEIRQILADGNIRLTKSLGQNFLHDGNQLRRIIEAAELKRTDKALEVGPGLGPLTELLVAKTGEVLAIEKDGRLVAFLSERFASARTLSLVHDDALDYLRRNQRDWSDWKLVANLPYSVGSPILVELARMELGPQRMVATVQIEVARRLMAVAGGDDYGVLTLLMQLDYEARGSFHIPASCFFPEPDVDSACVCLVRRQSALLPPEQKETFRKLVKRSFSQRRKMMLKLLREDWPEERLERAYAYLQLSPQARAETVSLDQFVQLAAILSADY